MDLAQNQVNTFNPSSPQRSVNESKFRQILDINDDGELNAKDWIIIAGIGLAGYFFFKHAFKLFRKGRVK